MNYIVSISEGKAHEVSSSQCSPADCYSINILDYGNCGLTNRYKKRRGSMVSFIAYPYSQALALPPSKDKQRKDQPTPGGYAYTHYGAGIPDIYIRR